MFVRGVLLVLAGALLAWGKKPVLRKFNAQAAPTLTFNGGEQMTMEDTPFFLSERVWLTDSDTNNNLYANTLLLSATSGNLWPWAHTQNVVWGSGTSTVNITGNIDGLAVALSNIKYAPYADFAGMDTIYIRVYDHGNEMASLSIGVRVNDTNDAPVVTVPVNATTMEDHLAHVPMWVTDADAGNYPIRITVNASVGTLWLDWTQATPTVTPVVDLPGLKVFETDQTNVNRVLNSTRFMPDHEWVGDVMVSINANDLGHHSSTGFTLPWMEASAEFMIMVTGVNDVPFILPMTLSTSEDTILAVPVQIRDNDIDMVDSITDPLGVLTVTLMAGNGTLSFTADTTFPTISSRPQWNAATKTWTLMGKSKAVQNTLNSTMYTPNMDWSGTDWILVTAWDGGAANAGLIKAVATYQRRLYVTVTGKDDTGRLTGIDGTFFVHRNMSLRRKHVQLYDIDTMGGSYELTINSTYGGVSITDPSAAGVVVTNGHWYSSQEGITFRGNITQVNEALVQLAYQPLKCMGVSPSKECPLFRTDDWTDFIDWVTVTVTQLLPSASDPASETFKFKVVTVADLFRTCSDFVTKHTEYCGCYYNTNHPHTSTAPWAYLPLDFPMKYYSRTVAAPRRFVQGCCSTFSVTERAAMLTDVETIGLCSVGSLSA